MCFTDAFFASVIEQVRDEVGLDHVVIMGAGDAPHDLDYEELLGAAKPVIPDEPDEDDPVVLMYTGGTTGTPKGVLLDHRAEMLNLYHVALAWRITSDEVYLHQTPMFHAASMGGIVGVPAEGGLSVIVPLFDPVGVMDAIEQHKVTMTVMVPTMVGACLLATTSGPSAWRACRNPPTARRRCRRRCSTDCSRLPGSRRCTRATA